MLKVGINLPPWSFFNVFHYCVKMMTLGHSDKQEHKPRSESFPRWTNVFVIGARTPYLLEKFIGPTDISC